jgi:hypothetical protein
MIHSPAAPPLARPLVVRSRPGVFESSGDRRTDGRSNAARHEPDPQITRPMKGIRRARDQRNCAIKITAPSFLGDLPWPPLKFGLPCSKGYQVASRSFGQMPCASLAVPQGIWPLASRPPAVPKVWPSLDRSLLPPSRKRLRFPASKHPRAG